MRNAIAPMTWQYQMGYHGMLDTYYQQTGRGKA
jgi:hypothetical protein